MSLNCVQYPEAEEGEDDVDAAAEAGDRDDEDDEEPFVVASKYGLCASMMRSDAHGKSSRFDVDVLNTTM
jgi:hypothetical protein